MSCNNVYLKNAPCAKSIGGIKRVWWANFEDIAIVYDWDDAPNLSKNFNPNIISGLYFYPDRRFHELVTKPDKVTITENITVDETVGNDTTTTEIVIKQSDMLSEAVELLKKSANSEYIFMFEDMQGRYFIYGLDKPVKLSSATVEGGNVIGDFNGGTFTFTCEGVLSRFWTKYEAETGDWTSKYINVKKLLNNQYELREFNLNNAGYDGDINFLTNINVTSEGVKITFNLDDNHFRIGHIDKFYISEMITTPSEIKFDNDEMYNITRYYYNKGFDFKDKKEFTAVYSGDGVNHFTISFTDGTSGGELCEITDLPMSKLFLFKGEVSFNRGIGQDEIEDIITIKQILYLS